MSPLEKDLQPGEPWRFDAEVAGAFDEMLERSIPTYHAMRDLVLRVAAPFLGRDVDVLDLGCSTGETLAMVNEAYPRARLVGIDASPEMVEVARSRFPGAPVTVHLEDLRESFPIGPWDVIFAILTVQFIPVEYRHSVFAAARVQLRPTGALILVEKTLGNTVRGHGAITEAYHGAKRDAGYTDEEVRRKALSLEGVLTPLPEATTLAMLAGGGFRHLEPFWRWGPFAGWLCLP